MIKSQPIIIGLKFTGMGAGKIVTDAPCRKNADEWTELCFNEFKLFRKEGNSL